jgi:tetratricopeptide (TPR) repeat protein
MPRFPSSDIAHTAVTDHRILRRPDRSEHKPASLRDGALPIVNYFKDRLRPEDTDVDRDLGIALAYLVKARGPVAQQMTARALPLLDGAVARHPNDLPAVEARGWALDMLDRRDEALKAYEAVLHQAPRRELTLALAAPLAERLGRSEQALAYRRRLVEINPWISSFRTDLAKLLCDRGQWDAALPEAEAAVRLNQADSEARMVLILACLRTGQRERAEREMNVLLALRPQDAFALLDWYRHQAR